MSFVMIIPIGPSGNLLSVERAINELGYRVEYYKKGINLDLVHSVILPGVGTFSDSMEYLKEDLDFIKSVIKSKPTLGICLGMQLLASIGFEGGTTLGMNILNGEVVKVRVNGSLPHIGWTELKIVRESKILNGVDINDRFYFMHSFELINYTDFVGLSTYNDHQFVSVVEKDNVFGVQFHPEKSGSSGLKVLRNFLSIGDLNE